MICASPGFLTTTISLCRPSASRRIPPSAYPFRRPGQRCLDDPHLRYEGQLETADHSPVPGLKLAYVGDDTSYLLYSGRWFPVSGDGLNRFTASISVTVPAHMRVIGSGKSTVSENPPSTKPNSNGLPTKTFTFVYTKPSFPGTIVAGVFEEYKSDEAGMDLHVFFKPTHQKLAPEYTTTAVQEFTYFITLYGTPLSQRLNVVELPNDTVPYAWAPEIAGLAGPSITEKTNYRLLVERHRPSIGGAFR